MVVVGDDSMELSRFFLLSVTLEVPLRVTQWANVSRSQPTRDAMEVEGVIADAPCHRALLRCGTRLIGLTFDAQVHDVISANGTRVHNNVY